MNFSFIQSEHVAFTADGSVDVTVEEYYQGNKGSCFLCFVCSLERPVCHLLLDIAMVEWTFEYFEGTLMYDPFIEIPGLADEYVIDCADQVNGGMYLLLIII